MNLRVVSGGQTGADRAALDAARAVGLETGGWCPRGRRAEDGRIPGRYPLRETPSEAVEQRTEWNVRDSDATLILVLDAMDRGTSYTEEQAQAYGKPLRIVELTGSTDAHDKKADEAGEVSSETVGEEVRETARWLKARNVSVLNVAGPRESNAPGLYAAAQRFLLCLFERLQV